ncbi:MAG: hypothetical protein ACFFG0_07955 [Candidatus Thorarchaeota archaeon]
MTPKNQNHSSPQKDGDSSVKDKKSLTSSDEVGSIPTSAGSQNLSEMSDKEFEDKFKQSISNFLKKVEEDMKGLNGEFAVKLIMEKRAKEYFGGLI